jgi:NAD(P)-dependent dehydrogenase (short-subunit alcohol dehydrogenase family)
MQMIDGDLPLAGKVLLAYWSRQADSGRVPGMKPQLRTILITGCSTGIGYTVAHGLKARGWRVFATARKPDDVARLNGEGLESLQLDMNDSGSINDAFTEIMARTEGRLDALFNNGGYGQVGAVEDLPRDALRAQFETNLFGWIELTNLAIPVMRNQGHGRIVMNSSVLGYAAFPYRGAYNAVKFAVEGITDTLRLELAGTGIGVSLVEPGPIVSRFRENCQAPFEKHIDWQHSVHRRAYGGQLARLNKPGPAAPFTLPPEAVLTKVIHALESRRPRPRYPITVPSVLFGWLKRVLPVRAMDWVLMQASGGGKR